jgi:hypothetical protein
LLNQQRGDFITIAIGWMFIVTGFAGPNRFLAVIADKQVALDAEDL